MQALPLPGDPHGPKIPLSDMADRALRDAPNPTFDTFNQSPLRMSESSQPKMLSEKELEAGQTILPSSDQEIAPPKTYFNRRRTIFSVVTLVALWHVLLAISGDSHSKHVHKGHRTVDVHDSSPVGAYMDAVLHMSRGSIGAHGSQKVGSKSHHDHKHKEIAANLGHDLPTGLHHKHHDKHGKHGHGPHGPHGGHGSKPISPKQAEDIFLQIPNNNSVRA